MGWYIRKSWNFGPFRLNLSKSGVGASAGVTGARIGLNSRGAYIHVGRHGIYYRQTLFGLVPPVYAQSPGSTTAHGDGDKSSLVDIQTSELISQINARIARPKTPSSTLSSGFLIATLLLVLSCLGSCLLGSIDSLGGGPLILALPLTAVIAPFAVIVFALRKRARETNTDYAQRVTELRYELDSSAIERLQQFQSGCHALSAARGLWAIHGQNWVLDGRRFGGAKHLLDRSPAKATRMAPPYISTNVDIWGIDSAGIQVMFFPDQVLVFDGTRYGCLSYDTIQAGIEPQDFLDDNSVGSDAEIVGHEWRYQRVDGGPDRRFASNYRIPVRRYTRLWLTSNGGFHMELQVSNRKAAESFARLFPSISQHGYDEERSGSRSKSRSRESAQDRASGASNTHDSGKPATAEPTGTAAPHTILGVAPNASPEEVSCAYRGLVKKYHPDTVADHPPEFRELAEQRMKEINAAYKAMTRTRRT